VVLGLAVGEVAEVLHGDDVREASGLFDLGDRHLGQTDVADLAFLLEQDQFAELLGQRHLRVNAVQLVSSTR
jgi:hypothetical protein